MARTLSPVALAAITAGVVIAGVGAGILLQPTANPAAAETRGPNVSIDVVAPREPELEPGSVMDVGELADGYTHRGYAQHAENDPPSYVDAEDFSRAPSELRRVERTRDLTPEAPRPPIVVERREQPWRWPFGFDQPRPDYAAERRERGARMDDQRRLDEARMRERYEEGGDPYGPGDGRYRDAPPDSGRAGRERQWYSSDGSRVSGPEPLD